MNTIIFIDTVQKWLVYFLIPLGGRCGWLWNDGIFQKMYIFLEEVTTWEQTNRQQSLDFSNNKNMYVTSNYNDNKKRLQRVLYVSWSSTQPVLELVVFGSYGREYRAWDRQIILKTIYLVDQWWGGDLDAPSSLCNLWRLSMMKTIYFDLGDDEDIVKWWRDIIHYLLGLCIIIITWFCALLT